MGLLFPFLAIMNPAQINISVISFGENGYEFQLDFYLGVKCSGHWTCSALVGNANLQEYLPNFLGPEKYENSEPFVKKLLNDFKTNSRTLEWGGRPFKHRDSVAA